MSHKGPCQIQYVLLRESPSLFRVIDSKLYILSFIGCHGTVVLKNIVHINKTQVQEPWFVAIHMQWESQNLSDCVSEWRKESPLQ